MQRYAEYFLPGNLPRRLILGKHNLLIQETENGVLIHEFDKGKLFQKRTVRGITDEESVALTHLGCATGDDLLDCLFLASKKSRNLLERVTAYRCQYPQAHGAPSVFDFYA